MEIWDLYDINHQKTAETCVRDSKVPAGRYHMVIHVCAFNSRGEMLIQHRQPFKDGFPNLWDVTVGGSAIAGETSAQAAKRELGEEVGLHHSFEGARPVFTRSFSCGFDDYYIIDIPDDLDITTLSLQPEEVQAVHWATLDDILARIDDGTFIPYYPSFIRYIFDIHANHAKALNG